MKTITLYRYVREGGGITISPNKPNCEYTIRFRLIADDGKSLTKNNVDSSPCVDVNSADGWQEVMAPKETGEALQ